MRTTPCLLSDDICLFETPMELTHKVGTRQILFRASGLFWWGHFSLFCTQEASIRSRSQNRHLFHSYNSGKLSRGKAFRQKCSQLAVLSPEKVSVSVLCSCQASILQIAKENAFPLTHNKMQNSLFALFDPSWIFLNCCFRKIEMGELDNMKFIVEGLGLVSIFLKITTNSFLFRCLLAFLE